MSLTIHNGEYDSKQAFDQIKDFFNVLKANVVRSRTTITAVFLSASFKRLGFQQEDLTSYLGSKIRKTDFLFELKEPHKWCIILSQSGEEEAQAFLNRLFADTNIVSSLTLSATIIEIGNNRVEFEELLEVGNRALDEVISTGSPFEVTYISQFKEKDIEKIKVSILEENEIFRNVLSSSMENMNVDMFELEIKAFSDGYDFLESNWYRSSHTHIIIMNDILPRKNGLEVLHMVKQLPNEQRFITYMMTKKKSEEDMLYAYEIGVDEYLIKPFNIRLFEAQIRRTFERLWL
ncbi:response regulator [Psychrobacillus sp. MER TA 171]|uniref:response regulator transcription factor n=1 Tax=Psychrobacillus sp. MER TA 171 TaxID=2939577 RepID=UPI002040211E|nr:response regulator [Psychrobacillus sp. MER TA 171]MCM3357934.1 response regulator [Psychrobacillus sp. MER TA 171]